MNTLFPVMGIAILTMLSHVSTVRFMPSGWSFRSIPLIYVLSACIVSILWFRMTGNVGLTQAITVFVTSLSLIVCYALTFVGIAHDSPTLALVKAIERTGDRGLSEADFRAFVESHPFMESRISALIAAGELREHEGGILSLSGKAIRLLEIGDLYRRLRGNSLDRTG